MNQVLSVWNYLQFIFTLCCLIFLGPVEPRGDICCKFGLVPNNRVLNILVLCWNSWKLTATISMHDGPSIFAVFCSAVFCITIVKNGEVNVINKYIHLHRYILHTNITNCLIVVYIILQNYNIMFYIKSFYKIEKQIISIYWLYNTYMNVVPINI